MARRKKQQGNGTGIGVDAFGGAVVDPSKNVRQLAKHDAIRQDDLRKAERRWLRSEISRIEDKANFVKEITVIHQVHDYALHKAEQGRLDALRANDREDVKALAAQTTAKAEALQKQVEASAQALAASFAAAMGEQNKERRQNKEDTDKRLSALERAQSEGTGKAEIESPMMSAMISKIEKLTESVTNQGGQKQGALSTRAMIAGGIGILAALFTIVGTIIGVALYISKIKP